MVEGARLESVCRGNSTVGSNPTLSAIFTRSARLMAVRVVFPFAATCFARRERHRIPAVFANSDPRPPRSWPVRAVHQSGCDPASDASASECCRGSKHLAFRLRATRSLRRVSSPSVDLIRFVLYNSN